MPLQRRLPKRGFHNPFRVAYEVVNVGQLEVFDAGVEVTPAALQGRRLLRRGKPMLKILGDGTLTRGLTVHAHAVSTAARQKIEAAGGRVEIIA